MIRTGPQLQRAIGIVRGNDTTAIQRDFSSFVTADLAPLSPGVHLTAKTKLGERGWSHPMLGPMLLPLQYPITDE